MDYQVIKTTKNKVQKIMIIDWQADRLVLAVSLKSIKLKDFGPGDSEALTLLPHGTYEIIEGLSRFANHADLPATYFMKSGPNTARFTDLDSAVRFQETNGGEFVMIRITI